MYAIPKILKTEILPRPFTDHFEILSDAVTFIQSIKVVNPATGEDRTQQIKCFKGWCIILNAIKSIWKQLSEDGIIHFLVTRQLNQVPLEICLVSIRQQGGNSDNPTPVQFIRGYRKLFHSNHFSTSTGNCPEDGVVPLKPC